MRYFVLLGIMFLASQAWAIDNSIGRLTREIEQASPDSKFQYYQFRARAYAEEGMPEGALKDLTTSINLNPTISAYRERADILIELDRYQEALNDLNIVLKNNPGDLNLYRLRSSVYFKMEQYRAAMADAQRVLAQMPDDNVSNQIVRKSTIALTPVKNIVMNTRHERAPARRQAARKVFRKPTRPVRRTAVQPAKTSPKPRKI